MSSGCEFLQIIYLKSYWTNNSNNVDEFNYFENILRNKTWCLYKYNINCNIKQLL